MTSLQTNSFNFYTFDPNNPSHINFVNELISDRDMQTYLRQFYKYLAKQDHNDPLNSAFLVGYKDNIIGYINLINYEKIEEIHLGVHPNFRGVKNSLSETIAYTLTKETCNMLLNNYKLIEYLRLYIDKSNIKSIKLAEKCGFTCYDETKDYYEYREYSHHHKSIITPHFEFLSFDRENQNHLNILLKLSQDAEIKKYFGNLTDYFESMIYGDGLEGVYLVSKDNEIIGFLNIYDYYKLLEFQFGLLEPYRSKSLGTQILKESAEELFKRYSYLEIIRAYVDKDNIRTIKAATKAGFKLVDDSKSMNEFRRTR